MSAGDTKLKLDVAAIRSRRRKTALGILVPMLVAAFHATAQKQSVAASAAPSLSIARVPPFEVWGNSSRLPHLKRDLYSTEQSGKLTSIEIGHGVGNYLDGTLAVIGWRRGDWEVALAQTIVESGVLAFAQPSGSPLLH